MALIRLIGLLLCLPCGFTWGQTSVETSERSQPVHWAFASLVGTGWYDVRDGRSAFIFGITPRQSIRDPELFESGERQVGIGVRYDSAVGLYNIHEIVGIVDAENFSTLTFTPGLEFEIPVNDRWRLRSYANFGWGTALDDDLSAWIWFAGIKSRYRFDIAQGRLALLNGLYYAGYSPDPGPRGSLAALFAGLEFTHGARWLRWGDTPLVLIWHFGYTSMSDSADFGLRDSEFKSINDAGELGVAIARRGRPFQFGWFEFERLGLTYTRGEGGEFGAVTLNLTSWFDR